jgi:hypothetical protein
MSLLRTGKCYLAAILFLDTLLMGSGQAENALTPQVVGMSEDQFLVTGWNSELYGYGCEYHVRWHFRQVDNGKPANMWDEDWLDMSLTWHGTGDKTILLQRYAMSPFYNRNRTLVETSLFDEDHRFESQPSRRCNTVSLYAPLEACQITKGVEAQTSLDAFRKRELAVSFKTDIDKVSNVIFINHGFISEIKPSDLKSCFDFKNGGAWWKNK